MKPAETGVETPETLGPDGRLLQWAAECGADPDLISPYRLRIPVAPAVAAKEEGIALDPGRLVEAAHRLSKDHDFLIVEGVGGLMVPLAGGYLVADLAREIGFPLLVVAGAGLGTLNHTLLTLFTARAMDLPLAGFLINSMPAAPGVAEKTAPHTLSSLASADLLGVLEQVKGDEREKVAALAAQIAGLPTLPWLAANLGLPSDILK
jgi:dethiobiotin synthetase